MVSWPRYRTCCCGCALRSATLALGWMFIIGGVLNILNSVRGFTNNDQMEYLLREFYPDCDQQCRSQIISFVFATTIVGLVMNVIYLVIGSLTVHGVNKNKPHLLTAYLFGAAVSILLSFVMWIVLMVYVAPMSVVACVIITIIIVCNSALTAYFALVVKSYQTELQEGHNGNPVPMSMY